MRCRKVLSRHKGDFEFFEFDVKCSSTSHFTKKIKINYYWVGKSYRVESEEVEINFSNRIEKRLKAKIKTIKSLGGKSYRLYIGGNSYSWSKDLDLMVTIEDDEGIIEKSYYNSKGEKVYKSIGSNP